MEQHPPNKTRYYVPVKTLDRHLCIILATGTIVTAGFKENNAPAKLADAKPGDEQYWQG